MYVVRVYHRLKIRRDAIYIYICLCACVYIHTQAYVIIFASSCWFWSCWSTFNFHYCNRNNLTRDRQFFYSKYKEGMGWKCTFPERRRARLLIFFFISLQRDIIVSKEMFLRIFDVKKKKMEETVRFFFSSTISRRTERKSSPSLTDIGVKVN